MSPPANTSYRGQAADTGHSLCVVGYLGRDSMLAARLRRVEEERVREPGWIQRFRAS
ncbi:MAG: hypothetical protein AB7O65_06380 [Candidatus Korobacteraceae bacterium]